MSSLSADSASGFEKPAGLKDNLTFSYEHYEQKHTDKMHIRSHVGWKKKIKLMDGSCKMKVQPFSQKGFSPGWTLPVSFSVLYDVAMQKHLQPYLWGKPQHPWFSTCNLAPFTRTCFGRWCGHLKCPTFSSLNMDILPWTFIIVLVLFCPNFIVSHTSFMYIIIL